MKTPIDRLMDAQYCKRWSMVGHTGENTVATHSFNVAMIAMAIRSKMKNTIHFSEQEVCYYALIHDVKEVYTGDIPTPTKNKMKASGFDPETYDPEVPDEGKPTDHVHKIIKLADLIDNWLFISQHGHGTRAGTASAEVHGRLRAALDGASDDMREAASYVLEYIMGRKSETDEERRKFKEDRERSMSVRRFLDTSNIVGGKPNDQCGNTGS